MYARSMGFSGMDTITLDLDEQVVVSICPGQSVQVRVIYLDKGGTR